MTALYAFYLTKQTEMDVNPEFWKLKVRRGDSHLDVRSKGPGVNDRKEKFPLYRKSKQTSGQIKN